MSDYLFPQLWRASWQAGILVVLVLAAQFVFQRRISPAWRHRLWWLVALRLALPVLPESPLSVFNLVKIQPIARPASTASTEAFNSIQPFHPTRTSTPPLPLPPRTEALSASPVQSLATQLPTTPRMRPAPAMARRPVDWSWWVRRIWGAGAGLLFLRLAWQNVAFARRLHRHSHLAGDAIHEAANYARQALNVRQTVAICETPLVKSPALYGLIRTRLLIPEGLGEAFSPGELRYVMLHEFAHVRRYDMAENWLVCALQILHWFNPLVWLGFARMRSDRELACDALAMSAERGGDHRQYGRAIVKLLEQMSQPAPMAGLVGLLEDKDHMRRRIRMITHFQGASRWSALAVALFIGLGLITLTDGKTGGSSNDGKALASDKRISSRGTNQSLAKLAASEIPSGTNCVNKVYSLNQTALRQNLERATGLNLSSAATNSQQAQATLRHYFTQLTGVDFISDGLPERPQVAVLHDSTPLFSTKHREDYFNDPTNLAANIPEEERFKNMTGSRRVLFFNNQTSTLFVRALPSELAAVERAIGNLDLPPAPIYIRAILMASTLDETRSESTAREEARHAFAMDLSASSGMIPAMSYQRLDQKVEELSSYDSPWAGTRPVAALHFTATNGYPTEAYMMRMWTNAPDYVLRVMPVLESGKNIGKLRLDVTLVNNISNNTSSQNVFLQASTNFNVDYENHLIAALSNRSRETDTGPIIHYWTNFYLCVKASTNEIPEVSTASDGFLTLSYAGIDGRKYHVQGIEDLSHGPWVDLFLTNPRATNWTNGSPAQLRASALSYEIRVLYEHANLDEAEAKIREALQEQPDNRGAKYYQKLIQESRLKWEKAKAQSSPQTLEIEKVPEATLLTELMPVDANSLRRRLHFATPAGPTNASREDEAQFHFAIRRYFSEATGINFDRKTSGGDFPKNQLPPKRNLLYDENRGVLAVSASAAELQRVRQAIESLPQDAPRVNVSVKLMELPADFCAPEKYILPAEADVLFSNSTNGSSSKLELPRTLSEVQFRLLKTVWKRHKNVRNLSEGSLTTLNERKGHMSMINSDYNLTVSPLIATNGYAIQIEVDLSCLKSSLNGAAKMSDSKHPVAIATNATIWDGQTLLLPVHSTTASNVMLFVTAKIIDAEGKRIHREDERPAQAANAPLSAKTLVEEGVAFYKQGKMDEAEAKIEQALLREPNNSVAKYYRQLIQENRFRQKNETAAKDQALTNQVFKIDVSSDTVQQAISRVTGVFLSDPESITNGQTQESLRRYFNQATGIDFMHGGSDTNSTLASTNEGFGTNRAMFFNGRTGGLFVRALPSEFKKVEYAIQAMLTPPAQIHVQAEIMEVMNDGTPGLGIDAQNAEILASVFPPGKPVPSAVLLSAVHSRMLKNALSQRPGARHVASLNLTTLNARQSETAMNRENEADSEYLLNILPVSSTDDTVFIMSLDVTAKITSGLTDAKEAIAKPLIHLPSPSGIGPGQTLLLTRILKESANHGSANVATNYYLFVTTDL